MYKNFTGMLVLLVMAVTPAIAADDVPPAKNFTSLCVEDKNTGFNWENRRWNSVNFRLNKYIVKSVSVPTKQPMKGLTPKKLLTLDRILRWSKCKDIKKLDDKNGVGLCVEFQTLGKSKRARPIPCYLNTKYGERILCEKFGHDFYMEPNGLFHRTYVHDNLDTTRDYKDSMSMSVGKCAEIDR